MCTNVHQWMAAASNGNRSRALEWCRECASPLHSVKNTCLTSRLYGMSADAPARILAADSGRKARDAMMAERYSRRIQERKGLTRNWCSMYAHDYPADDAQVVNK